MDSWNSSPTEVKLQDFPMEHYEVIQFWISFYLHSLSKLIQQ